VHANDYEGFVDAIRHAASTEIGRYILPHMTDVAVRRRLRKLMETDWRAEAAVLLKERLKQGGDAHVSCLLPAI
jgi:hypothetical protein